MEDYRNAISWVAAQKEVDDQRIKAVVSLLPLIDGLDGYWTRAIAQDLLPDLRAKIQADRRERYGSGKVNYMPVVAPPGQPAVIPGKAAHD